MFVLGGRRVFGRVGLSFFCMRAPGFQLIRYIALLALAILLGGPALKAIDIQPMGRGPYAVGTTNMEIDPAFANLSSAEMDAYLTRTRSDGRYLSDILRYRADSVTFTVTVPSDRTLYGAASGTRIDFTAFIAYPTSPDNGRNDYTFPHDNPANAVLERMQGPGERPIFAEPHVRYPLIVASHGGGVHNIHEFGHCSNFASHGYIAAAIAHGDGNFDFNRNELYTLRPLAVKALVDLLLGSEDFGPHIDANRIGVTGHSWGGMTALAVGGAKLFNDPSATTDDRITAIVALEPSIISPTGTIFGASNIAITAIDKPYLHINGTEFIYPTAAVRLVSGSVYSITLPGQPHVFQTASWSDTQNWELVFFGAYLKNDPRLLELLRTADSVEGFNADFQLHASQRLRPRPAPSPVQAFGTSQPPLGVVADQNPSGAAFAVAFPADLSNDSPLRYDLQYYAHEHDAWLTLAAGEVLAEAPFVLDHSPPSGFAWRVLQDPIPPDQNREPRLYRVRVSQP